MSYAHVGFYVTYSLSSNPNDTTFRGLFGAFALCDAPPLILQVAKELVCLLSKNTHFEFAKPKLFK